MSLPPSSQITHAKSEGANATSRPNALAGNPANVLKAEVIATKVPTTAQRHAIISAQLAAQTAASNPVSGTASHAQQNGQPTTANATPPQPLPAAQQKLSNLTEAIRANPPLPKNASTSALGLNTNASPQSSQPPSNAAQLSVLPQRIAQLLTHPNLLVAKIQVGRQSQWVFTDLALKIGDKVTAQKTQNGHLVLTAANQSLPKQPPLTASEALVSAKPLNVTATPTPLSSGQTSALLDVVKQTLPQQKPLSELLNQLRIIQKELSNHAISSSTKAPVENSLPTNNVLAAAGASLKSLNNQTLQILKSGLINSPHLTANDVAQAIKTNGAQLERHLAYAANLKPALDAKVGIAKDASANTDNLIATDLKNQLLNLASTLGILPNNGPRATSGTLTTGVLEQLLLPFFNSKLSHMQKEVVTNAFSAKQATLIAKLAQTIERALASVRLNQAQQLLQLDHSPSDTARLPTFNAELTLRHNDIFFPLFLTISQRWKFDEETQDNSSKDENSHRKKKVWEVFLEFELEKLGELAAKITLEDTGAHAHERPCVNTMLWAKKKQVREMLAENAQKLEESLNNSGMHSVHIECSAGELPSHTNVHISQSLIDVRT